jgi:ABC-2 type transport system permease protein
MRWAMFVETLRRNWRGMVYWGIGVGLLTFVQIIIVPDVEMLQDMAQMMETLPSWMLSAFGIDDMEYMATAEGYVALQFFSYALIMFSIYAVVAGLGVTSGDEDRGTLDMVLTTPLPRSRLVLEKFGAYALLTLGYMLITYLWLLFAVLITPALVLDLGKVFAATLNLVPATLMVLAFATLMGALIRRRGMVVAISAAFIAVSYTFQLIGSAAGGGLAATLQSVSYFHYADGVSFLTEGVNWGNLALISGLAVAMLLVGLWRFQRRDIGGL